MSEKPYDLLPTACVLSVTSLTKAYSANPPIYLHVHPDMVDLAKTIVGESNFAFMRVRTMPRVISDATLERNEWYVVSAIGSNPP